MGLPCPVRGAWIETGSAPVPDRLPGHAPDRGRAAATSATAGADGVDARRRHGKLSLLWIRIPPDLRGVGYLSPIIPAGRAPCCCGPIPSVPPSAVACLAIGGKFLLRVQRPATSFNPANFESASPSSCPAPDPQAVGQRPGLGGSPGGAGRDGGSGRSAAERGGNSGDLLRLPRLFAATGLEIHYRLKPCCSSPSSQSRTP